MLIKIRTKEYLDKEEAVHSTVFSFLGIPIFIREVRTLNIDIKRSMMCPKTDMLHKEIKGFKDETKNKSKKVKSKC